MAKADVTSFAQDLGQSLADSQTLDQYYDEAVDDLSKQAIVTEASLLEVTPGTRQYSLPTNGITLLEVFYDDRVLARASLQEMMAVDPYWRDAVGRPYVYVTEAEDDKTFSLYPTPNINSKDFAFLFGSPFGLDYPEYAVAVIHSNREDTAPKYLEGIIGLTILGHEFRRESDHRDTAFANAATQLANFLTRLVPRGT